MIPLRLVANNNLILWINQVPQSIRFCRPLKLEYMRKTKEHVLKEKNEIDQQIEKFSDFEMELPNDKVLKINYKLYILNILTDTKSFLLQIVAYITLFLGQNGFHSNHIMGE